MLSFEVVWRRVISFNQSRVRRFRVAHTVHYTPPQFFEFLHRGKPPSRLTTARSLGVFWERSTQQMNWLNSNVGKQEQSKGQVLPLRLGSAPAPSCLRPSCCTSALLTQPLQFRLLLLGEMNCCWIAPSHLLPIWWAMLAGPFPCMNAPRPISNGQ